MPRDVAAVLSRDVVLLCGSHSLHQLSAEILEGETPHGLTDRLLLGAPVDG
ncbi:MAG: hypothetical protein HY000_14110 [Planctomycetes bacterium]|nr:hypothetical protein [Planctomycetota bacterium]